MRFVRLSRPKGNVWLHRQEKPNELTCSTESIGRGFRERWRKPAPTLASLGYCFMISRPLRCAACCAAGLPNLYHENQGSGSVCKTDPLAASASSASLARRGGRAPGQDFRPGWAKRIADGHRAAMNPWRQTVPLPESADTRPAKCAAGTISWSGRSRRTAEDLSCESGGIGRRTRLRIWRVKPWGFESPLSHQTILVRSRPLSPRSWQIPFALDARRSARESGSTARTGLLAT